MHEAGRPEAEARHLETEAITFEAEAWHLEAKTEVSLLPNHAFLSVRPKNNTFASCYRRLEIEKVIFFITVPLCRVGGLLVKIIRK